MRPGHGHGGGGLRGAAYERRLRRIADELGLSYRHYWLASAASLDDLCRVVDQLNADPSVHGKLLLPLLLKQIAKAEVFAGSIRRRTSKPCPGERRTAGTRNTTISSLDAGVDVPPPRRLVGRHRIHRVRFYPGATIVVVGRSNNVGKPALALGHARDAVVVSCHERASRSGRLAEFTLQADGLIVAAGLPNLIGVEHVADGAVLIDVGINPVTDPATGRVRPVGDIDLPAVMHLARAATPIPGGMGPVTDVWLVNNCAQAAALRA